MFGRTARTDKPLAAPSDGNTNSELGGSTLTRHAALPPTLAPRLIIREAAAAFICVSPNTFDKMVSDGTMPRPRKISGTRIGWDVQELHQAVDALPHRGGDDGHDTSNEGWDDAPQAAA
jgi:predicted DNA-binding transcriptional regulator AlpA